MKNRVAMFLSFFMIIFISSTSYGQDPYGLIRNIQKKIIDQETYQTDTDGTVVVDATKSVGIQLDFFGDQTNGNVGVDIVFLIDNSGSMQSTDPQGKRFEAIKSMIAEFGSSRENLDRISVVTITDVPRVEQAFQTWSQTQTTIDSLLRTDLGSATDFNQAMVLSNDLLATQSNRLYKIGIILSDGDPEPDDSTYPQTTLITNERVPFAWNNNILYSTIYLKPPDPDNNSFVPPDNALLMYIAEKTDYLTPNIIGAPPKYYFKITDPDQIITAYRGLFTTLLSRIVPQDILFEEGINEKLIVDRNSPVTFTPIENIIELPLATSLEQFYNSGTFRVHLNELQGTSSLKFNVKLNNQALTVDDLNRGYVIVDVNNYNSKISYSHPLLDGGLASTCTIQPLPSNVKIKYLLGPQINKSLNQNNKSISIDISNAQTIPLKKFQIKELPSVLFDVSDIQHNFDSPALLILDKLIKPTILNKSMGQIEKSFPFSDPFLSSFNIPNNADMKQWTTALQRGIYEYKNEIPARDSMYIKFNLHDATYTSKDREPEFAEDCVDLDTQIPIFKSKYTYNYINWKDLTPNPKMQHYISPIKRPDIYVKTCFGTDIDFFYGKLLQSHLIPHDNPFDKFERNKLWSMLDSESIVYDPIGNNTGRSIDDRSIKNIEVIVNNCGMIAGQGSLYVFSYLIPVFKEKNNVENWSDRIYCGHSVKNISVPANSSISVTLSMSFDSRIPQDSPIKDLFPTFPSDLIRHAIRNEMDNENIESLLRKKMNKLLVINIVQIKSNDDILKANNNAIEILRFVMD